jgi:bacillithiol synthase
VAEPTRAESWLRVIATPLGPLPRDLPERQPRQVAADVIAAALPGPGRDRLAREPVLVVTTGQQPGLFPGPLYTIYNALSGVALARRFERERGVPVVPVFWVAGDDHDFAEANHTWVLDQQGEPAEIRLRDRPATAPLRPLSRERCGPEIAAALERLAAATPDSEFKPEVLAWLQAAYQPEASLADAFADALNALLGSRGLVVLRAYQREAKRASAAVILRGLEVTLPDEYTPVLLEASQGRDRLRAEGGAFVTRRSGERFTREALGRIAQEEPERLSPNVLLRPVVEAALLPTVAYAAGPAELEYLPQAAPLYQNGGAAIERQMPVPRWSGMLVEPRVERFMTRYGLRLEDLNGKPGDLESRLLRDTVPPETAERFAELRRNLERDYTHLEEAVQSLDPTLARPVQSAKHSALGGTHEIEKKLLASLKRENETLVRQVTRARAAVYPRGEAQERVLTLASFLIRYGPALLDLLEQEVARWADAS